MDAAKFYGPGTLTSKMLALTKLTKNCCLYDLVSPLAVTMVELQFAKIKPELIRKQACIKAEETILIKRQALAEAQTTLKAVELALNGECRIRYEEST